MTLNKYLFLLILIIIASPNSWALNSDKNKPVEVEADNFNLDEKKQITTYTGNVVITQGSMEIKANIVTIYGSKGSTDKVIATGNPVKFKQQPDGNQGLIRGEANQFDYLVTKDTLILINKATLWQSGNTFSSDRIVYDSKHSIVKAGDNSSGSKRVKVTLQPGKSAQ